MDNLSFSIMVILNIHFPWYSYDGYGRVSRFPWYSWDGILDQTVEIHHAHVALRNCAAPRRLIYRFYCVRTIVGEAAVL